MVACAALYAAPLHAEDDFGYAVAAAPPSSVAAQRWQRMKADESEAAAARASVSKARVAPLPIQSDPPAWLVPARPLSPEEADLTETADGTPTPNAVGKSSPDDSNAVSAAAHVSPTIIWPLLSLQDPRRKIRAINEISPVYDTMVDKEIREYADKQASEYGVQFGAETYSPRAFPGTVFAWEAANFWHYPLYFEDPALERYGHTHSFFVQPFVSAGRFSGQLLALPYQMTLDPVCECVYELGWYRPGDCAPKLHYRIPWSGHALLSEAVVVTGLVFLIP